MNLYEQAVERCEKAAQAVDTARAAYKAALDEQMQALTQLADYEEKPGIPLPQYQASYVAPPQFARDGLDSNVRDAAASNFRDALNPATGMISTEKLT